MKTKILQFQQKISIVLISMLSIATINAQIVYTDVGPDVTLDGASFMEHKIDLNNDLTDDFTIDHYSYNTDQYIELTASSANSEALVGVANHPDAFNHNDIIDGAQATWEQVSWAYMFQTGDVSCNWSGANDKYLGLRIKVSGQWHYGWIRLDVSLDGSSVTIKDYAYNSVANQQIAAGDNGATTITNAFESQSTIGVFPNPGNGVFSISVNKENTDLELNVLNSLGETIYTDFTYEKYGLVKMDISNNPKGVYYLIVKNGKDRKIQKIVVQ